MRLTLLLVASLAGACSPGAPPPPADAGGCQTACGTPCATLRDCDGGLGVAVCVADLCQPAGGAPVYGVARARLPSSFGGDPAATLAIRVLADARPDGSALDCPALIIGLDAGALDPDDAAAVNPLLSAYSVQPKLSSGQTAAEFGVQTVPGGPSRLLLVEGFLRVGDGGPAAVGCATYDALPAIDGGLPSVGITLSAW